MQTWLAQNGYSILWNACQTANMVRIGFLNRVRSFTFRDDLHTYITSSAEWKQNPFHFRRYFDAFGSKDKTAYVLMIGVERPKLEIGIQFFQMWYNGKQANSPNCLQYLFLPLYKKTYSEEERHKIVIDHEYHIGSDSVVAIKGLHPLDNLVKLVNGVYTTIQRLLLSVSAANTVTGKLFVQIERQPVPNWMLCCFHSRDATKVTLKLATLEDTLKKAVPQDHWNTLFLDEDGLKFSGQVRCV
jgi:hypothetical protein